MPEDHRTHSNLGSQCPREPRDIQLPGVPSRKDLQNEVYYRRRLSGLRGSPGDPPRTQTASAVDGIKKRPQRPEEGGGGVYVRFRDANPTGPCGKVSEENKGCLRDRRTESLP